MPSVLYQVASVSGDAIMFGLTLLFISWLARAFQEDVVSSKTRIALTVLSIALAFTKPTYFWIGWAALALVTRPALGSYQQRLTFIGLVLIGPILVHGFLIAKGFHAAPIAPGIDPVANWRDTLEHPIKFLSMLLRVPEAYPFGTRWNMWQSLIGKPGWLDAPLPSPLYPLLTAALVISAGAGKIHLPLLGRAFLFLLCVASIFIVALPIRIYGMPGPSDVMFGLAGRYFIPTLALLLLASNYGLPQPILREARVAVIAFAFIGPAAGIGAVIVRYYG